jgi:hypothetical protein
MVGRWALGLAGARPTEQKKGVDRFPQPVCDIQPCPQPITRAIMVEAVTVCCTAKSSRSTSSDSTAARLSPARKQ